MPNDHITIESKAFKMIMDKLTFLEQAYKGLSARQGFSKYMDEEEVILVTKLSKDSLRVYRRKGVLTGITSTGRKIKYLRKEIEAYLNGDMADQIYSLRQKKPSLKSA